MLTRRESFAERILLTRPERMAQTKKLAGDVCDIYEVKVKEEECEPSNRRE
jgi:hypothetical protein